MLRDVLRRHLLSASGIALVVACSYDWDVGKGGTSDAGDVAIIPPEDGGVRDAASADSAVVEAGGGATTGACGASCTCTGTQTCNFDCPSGKCAIDCSGSSNCTVTCGRGAQCTLACSDTATCAMDCSAGNSQCTFDCDDESKCSGTCQKASICYRRCEKKCDDVKCSNAGVCL